MPREYICNQRTHRNGPNTSPASYAYTSVQARRAFVRPEPPPPPPPPSYSACPTTPATQPRTQNKSRDWPLPVRQYVQRSFAEGNAIAGIGRPDMEAKLKKVISEAAESNTILSIDWDNLPLPQQMIQNKRMSYYATPVVPAGDQLSNFSVRETNVTSNGTHAKKRKSSELSREPQQDSSLPPWRNTNHTPSFGDRLSFPDKRQKTDIVGTTSSKSQNGLENRKRRFGENKGQSPSRYISSKDDSPSSDIDRGPIVGRCQTLEKKYFRLTSAPNLDTVRPLHILQQTLELLKTKWKKDNNYSYICDQFKSLRQDLTVQHIKTEFTVHVYEIHARIALEKGDPGEYNQCQTQLRALYEQKLGGHPQEFKAYRILYFLHTCNRTGMNDVLADLTPAEKKTPAIQHALEARSSLALGNYHRFFKLYLETPNMGAYLMDMFVPRERLASLANICKA